MALSLLTLLLARERFALVGSALGFCAVQSGISFALNHELVALAVSILTGIVFLLLIRSLRDYKPSYCWPKGLSIVDLLVGLSSLGLTIALFSWLRR